MPFLTVPADASVDLVHETGWCLAFGNASAIEATMSATMRVWCTARATSAKAGAAHQRLRAQQRVLPTGTSLASPA